MAAELNTPQQTVSNALANFTEIGNLSQSGKVSASHATDFDVPLYNVWKQQDKTHYTSHFGNSGVRWIERGGYAPLDGNGGSVQRTVEAVNRNQR